MNTKHLAALAVVAAISVAAAAWALQTRAPTLASDRRGESVLPSLLAQVNDITGVSIRGGADTLVIENRDGRFVASESGYPIKPDEARAVIASSATLTFFEARTSDPARYGDLGLADPGAKEASTEITFRTAGGELGSFIVGKSDRTVAGGAGGVFIRLKGQQQTYLARGSVQLPTFGNSGWYVPVGFDVKRSEINKVELTGGGRESLTLQPGAGRRGQFVLADVPENRTADHLRASLLASFVDSFTFRDVRRAAAKPTADARRLVVQAGEGLQIVLTAVGDIGEGWVHITAEAMEDAAKDKAKSIASRVEDYDFRLLSNEADRLGWTMADVSVERKN